MSAHNAMQALRRGVEELVVAQDAMADRLALAELRLATVRDLHVTNSWKPHESCRHCRRPWPCDTAKIVQPAEPA